MKTIVTVILYNKSIEDSLTINSLKKINYVDYELYIINNGPKEINFDLFKNSSFCRAIKKISFSEYLNNKPLSHIYNNVLNDNDSKRFIFLDDDSLIDHDFFYLIDKDYEKNPNVDLQVPVITDIKTKKIFYPRYNGQLLKENYVHLSSDKYLFHSIGSGLVIYRSLVDKFKQKYTEIFDPRFALYGVDVSLFRRIKFLEKKGQAINLHVISNIYHSLSRTEKVMSRWRYLERLYDELLTTKHYSKNIFTKLYSLLKIIVKDILYYKFKNMGLICKVYISGKHPRC